MKRTTVFVDDAVLSALTGIAQKEGRGLSATIRLALQEFVSRRGAARPLPSFLGLARSGRKDVAERADELLWTRPHDRTG